jgi:hypothetical protein
MIIFEGFKILMIIFGFILFGGFTAIVGFYFGFHLGYKRKERENYEDNLRFTNNKEKPEKLQRQFHI